MRDRLAILFMAALSVVAGAAAQTPPPAEAGATFEVASVKLNASGSTNSFVAWPPGGALRITNTPLGQIIALAYSGDMRSAFVFERYRIKGGDRDLLSSRFDITATAPVGTPAGINQPMLRALLADRFKLRVRFEPQPLPIYALTVSRPGRLGQELRESKHDCELVQAERRAHTPQARSTEPPRDAKGRALCFGGQFNINSEIHAGQIARLINGIQGAVDRPIVDATGLTGSFEWALEFARVPERAPDLPNIYTAVDEQLGLKLEPRTAPLDVVSIESVAMPTPD